MCPTALALKHSAKHVGLVQSGYHHHQNITGPNCSYGVKQPSLTHHHVLCFNTIRFKTLSKIVL